MANGDGSTIRTLREMTRRTWNLDWLGSSVTLEEYAVALYLEQHDVQYVYQQPYDGWRDDLRVDFKILDRGFPLVLEVLGDHWHQGLERIQEDRLRRLLIMEIEPTGVFVEVWGHDICGGYSGHEPPTDAEFERIMEAALEGIQLSNPWS